MVKTYFGVEGKSGIKKIPKTAQKTVISPSTIYLVSLLYTQMLKLTNIQRQPASPDALCMVDWIAV